MFHLYHNRPGLGSGKPSGNSSRSTQQLLTAAGSGFPSHKLVLNHREVTHAGSGTKLKMTRTEPHTSPWLRLFLTATHTLYKLSDVLPQFKFKVLPREQKAATPKVSNTDASGEQAKCAVFDISEVTTCIAGLRFSAMKTSSLRRAGTQCRRLPVNKGTPCFCQNMLRARE